MLGGLLSLLSAATFALNNASVRRGVLTGSVAQALAITLPVGIPIFLVTAWAFGSLEAMLQFSPMSLMWLSLAGVAHFTWGRYCNYRATKAMGAVLVGPVQQTSLVFTLAAAIWILDEVLTPLRLIGIGLVMLGPAIGLTSGEEKKSETAKADGKVAFKPDLFEGYLFALLSSTGYGISPILVRLGLEHGGIPASVAAGFISYTAATLAFALCLFWPGQLKHVLDIKPEAAKWFTISGVFVCVSQMFRYMALAVAPVSVVSPIQRLSILFRIYFAKILSPDHEVFGERILLGTVISLIGAVALSVSTEWVLEMVPLPEAIVTLARWQWP